MEPRWVLQMVGGVEGSTVAWAVRYYADGAAPSCNNRWWAALRGAPWRGQLGRQSDGAAMGTADGEQGGGEPRGVGS